MGGNEGHEGRGTKGDDEEGSNEGHEGDEEEGSDEGHEGDEEEGSDEGHEGHEEEGSDEGHEGHEEEGSHEGHEGDEEEVREQDRTGHDGQGDGAARQQGQDRRWLDCEGLDQEQAWQGREQEAKRAREKVPLDPGLHKGAQGPEDHGLYYHQEGHTTVRQGQGVLQPVSAAFPSV